MADTNSPDFKDTYFGINICGLWSVSVSVSVSVFVRARVRVYVCMFVCFNPNQLA